MAGESRKNFGLIMDPLQYTSSNEPEDTKSDASKSSSLKPNGTINIIVPREVEEWDLSDPNDARAFIRGVRVGDKQIHYIIDDNGNKILVSKATDKQVLKAVTHIVNAMRKGEATGKDH